jgi:hypothetical protein
MKSTAGNKWGGGAFTISAIAYNGDFESLFLPVINNTILHQICTTGYSSDFESPL